jgi:drug/metabolite transporter (DMT)-like permease
MGVAALFALLSSVSFGVSQVLSDAALRRHTTAALALWAQLTGLVVIAVVVAVVRPKAPLAGLAWGGVAGAVGALAVLAFYSALQRGSTTVVAPIAGCGVLVPVLVGVLRGETVGWRAGAGVVAAVVGVLIVARSGAGSDRRASQVSPARGHLVPAPDGCVPAKTSSSQSSSMRLAVASAAGLGAFFVLVDEATIVAGGALRAFETALVIALAVQVGALAVTLVAATRHTRRCLRLDRGLPATALAVGLLDLAGDVLLNLAIDGGSLAIVGPLGSLAPVVAVLLSTVVLRQSVARLQGLGIIIVLLGLGLIASD